MSNFHLALIPTENVGLALQQQVDAMATGMTTKRQRKTAFNRARRALVALQQIPHNVEITHIANGVTANGEHVIMVGVREQ